MLGQVLHAFIVYREFKLMKHIYIILIFLVGFYYPLIGQERGFLRGTVTDLNTGEELIGTTVAVVGSPNGTITDLDGNFYLPLEEGVYTIMVSYISYEAQSINSVKIINGETNILNVQLSSTTTELEEVRIVGELKQRTEAAMQVMQRKSATLLDGISSQQMSGLGDSDAGSALKRVTGVSVEGGKYVYVRGLGDRYTKTSLNGADIPSLDPNKNTVQMDMFPSNLIESMVVYKTFAPNLPGDFTGGYVDIVSKDFPNKLTLAFSANFGFNPQVSFNKDYLTYQTGKLDWLGIDDGMRKIPELASGDIPVYNGLDNPALDLITKSFNNYMEPQKGMAMMNQGYSFSYGNQIPVGKDGSLGLISSLTYKNEYRFYEDGETGIYTLVGSNSESLNNQQQFKDSKGIHDVLWGAMLSSTWKINAENKIGFTAIRNQSGESSARYQEGVKPSDDYLLKIQQRTLQFLQRGFTNGQIKGEHQLTQLNNIKAEWMGSFTKTTQLEPDLRFFNNDYTVLPQGDTLFAVSPNLYTVPTRYYRSMHESNFAAKADFNMPFILMGEKSKFSFGSSYTYKERASTERNFDIRDQNQSYNGSIEDYFNESNIGSVAPGSYGVYVSSSKNTEGINSYNGSQKVFSSYAMVDIPLWQNLRLVSGLRLEKTDIFVENLVNKSHSKYDQANINNTDLLPSINVIYNIRERTNFRLAGSRTIARPVFRELAPYAFYDFLSGRRKIGNPDLKRALITNFDFRYEFFFAPGEMISASAFYKDFKNPIEQVDNPQAVNAEITFQNAERARIYGFEIELRKNLDFIPLLKNFQLMLNAAYVKSLVSIDSLELQSIRATDPSHPDYRVMFGQAPYLVNTILRYDNTKIGLQSNLGFNLTGPRLYLVIKGGTPDVFEKPFPELNFNISKKLGKHTIKLKIDNILDSSNNKIYTYRDTDYTFEQNNYGRVFSLTYSYLLE